LPNKDIPRISPYIEDVEPIVTNLASTYVLFESTILTLRRVITDPKWIFALHEHLKGIWELIQVGRSSPGPGYVGIGDVLWEIPPGSYIYIPSGIVHFTAAHPELGLNYDQTFNGIINVKWHPGPEQGTPTPLTLDDIANAKSWSVDDAEKMMKRALQ